MDKIRKAEAFAALSYVPFRRFIIARLVSTLSVQIMHLVLGWMIYDITRDPLSLGLAGLAEIIPFLSVIWISGAIADRNNRKYVVLICLSGIFAGVLTLGLLQYLFFSDSRTATLLIFYAIIVLLGLVRGFFGPSLQAMVPNLVPSAVFTNATTWNTSMFHLGSVAGPAIGGFLYAFGGKELIFFIVLGLLSTAIILMSMVNYRQSIRSMIANKKESLYKGLVEGIRFVRSRQVIIGALSLDLFAVLFGGAVSMLPVFANEVLNCGAEGLGILRAAPAIGALTMGGILMFRPPGRLAGKKMLWSVAMFGLCISMFALSKLFWLSWILLFLSGLFDNISVVIRQTVVQMRTPDEMRGRVAAVNSIFIGMSNEIGALESGVAARLLGLIPSVFLGGMATILVVLVTGKVAPKLRNLDLTRFDD
jgi:MFS family permease